MQIEEANSKVQIVGTTYEYLDHIGEPIPMKKMVWKRFWDIIFGLIGLIISIPFIFVFGIIIKLTSKGPIFFKQERVGYMGKNFDVIKLRSMRNDAEAKTGAVWAQKNDPRVTAVGRFMRKTRIDELPQFWNVLKGDMSMIGPRPERPELTEKFYKQWPEFPQRLRIIPGITGYAQIHGGYDLKPNEKCKLDNYYIEHYSLWQDCKIAFETFKIIFTGDGAR
ncbi:exopolysaccharide biosynthesis polyprenyl glycosylphosphotransferase [Limosilactobacillus fermentum]|uniref:exopolysaccharide biosynthesis polyprenyl glycosylphosphotransferase n=1 Tax=Limosilactobacillus fermentum TaxID=1613 RepID=UPI000D311FB7|nr:exopolysaccharide biosynthesis polyprenyl glycosylphosphotransferase [Limosilactobacillus fermentum]PTV35842.1 UDP-phosphate N-acetylgalactosaminyl-1-phosphate transferase [Limosilactobacillus fermentum]QAR24810.1 exopolysaccharide biosynthesis polyprenyl glycosylphosphotransferase [Limosilactobacillus fermentum]